MIQVPTLLLQRPVLFVVGLFLTYRLLRFLWHKISPYVRKRLIFGLPELTRYEASEEMRNAAKGYLKELVIELGKQLHCEVESFEVAQSSYKQKLLDGSIDVMISCDDDWHSLDMQLLAVGINLPGVRNPYALLYWDKALLAFTLEDFARYHNNLTVVVAGSPEERLLKEYGGIATISVPTFDDCIVYMRLGLVRAGFISTEYGYALKYEFSNLKVVPVPLSDQISFEEDRFVIPVKKRRLQKRLRYALESLRSNNTFGYLSEKWFQ